MTRYGEALRADLRARYGIDMLGVFRDEYTAAELLAYIEALPTDSGYHAAMAADEELAEQIVAAADDDPDLLKTQPPSMAEFGPLMSVLAGIYDRLGHLIAIQTTAPGKSPSPPPGWPRPVTEIEKVRSRRRYEEHTALMARILPKPDP